jgi:hypothetical protein
MQSQTERQENGKCLKALYGKLHHDVTEGLPTEIQATSQACG